MTCDHKHQNASTSEVTNHFDDLTAFKWHKTSTLMGAFDHKMRMKMEIFKIIVTQSFFVLILNLRKI